MADNEQGDGANTRRSDWEVVSLTDSAYAAAPGPTEVLRKGDLEGNTYNEAETSRALFMSGHFVFPPSQHENLPLEPECDDIHEEAADKGVVAESVVEGDNSARSSDQDQALRMVHDEFPGIQFFDEKGNRLSMQSSEYKPDKEQSPYGANTLNSLHNETASGGPTSYGDNMPNEAVATEDTFDPPAESSQLSKPPRDDYFASNLPCSAWWKQRVTSLYAQAKDANTLWSIFIAAAVTGLVILGQQWQQERWQVLQQKWHLSLRDEKMGRVLGPIYRLKDVIVGGHRRGSLISHSSSSEN